MTRAIPELKGVANFRDFGLYAGSRGPMAQGVHFRSGHLAYTRDEDLEILVALDLRTVIDLRRVNEREKHPSRWGETLKPAVISNDLGFAAEAPHLAYLATVETMTPDAARNYLLTSYRTWPYEARHVDLYRLWFEALAEAPSAGAVLVHCAAGKDRTGLIVALTQRLAGVHDDDVMTDYLATNTHARVEQRLNRDLERVAAAFGRPLDRESGRMLMSAREEYLNAALTAMDDRDGSPEAYVRDVLGINARQRDRILARLLA